MNKFIGNLFYPYRSAAHVEEGYHKGNTVFLCYTLNFNYTYSTITAFLRTTVQSCKMYLIIFQN